MRRSSVEPQPERTPQARLSEARLHGIVGYQLAQATIVTTQVFDECVGGPQSLRPVEYTVLALVQANPGVTARQLATGLAMTPPNVKAWLDRLEARALLTRSRSTADARLQHLECTPAGSALAARSTALLLGGEEVALTVLSPAERAMLVELLHKVARSRKRAGAR